MDRDINFNFRNFRFTYWETGKTLPFKGPHALSAAAPYVLKSIDFDLGSEGVAFHKTNPAVTQGNYRAANGDNNSQTVIIQGDNASIGYNTAGDWYIYTVVVEDAGNYLIEIESAVTMWSYVHLEVDGVDVTGEVWLNDALCDGWSNFFWLYAGTKPIALTKGTHKIKYVMDRDINFNFRNFRFTYWEAGKTLPFKGPHTLSAAAPYVLKAIDFDLGGEGVGFHKTNPRETQGSYRAANGDNNSQTAFVQGDNESIGFNDADDWYVYTVDVVDAGNYFIEIDGAGGGEAKYHIEIEGINVTNTYSFASTGAWDNWLWKDGPDITLAVGKQKIKFYFEDGGTNIRNFRFTKQ
jgi:hypothetical protein